MKLCVTRIMVKNVRAIIFDFDGTIVDASEAIITCFNSVLRKHGLPGMPVDALLKMVGRPLRDIYAAAIPRAGPSEIELYMEEYRRMFFTLSDSLTRALPGAEKTLAHYSPRLKLGIATSRTACGAGRMLDGLGLREHFSAIVGIEDVKETKPNPEPVLLVLKLLGVGSGEAVMVGDTPDDIAAGKAAGLETAGVTSGVQGKEALESAGADYVLERLWDLTEIIKV